MAKRVFIVGAGPMGIAAALGAAERGFEVTVLERGEVGEALRRWGPTRFFSPLSMNFPPSIRARLDGALPPEDSLLTGTEMADLILAPLAQRAPLRGRVLTHHTVTAIGRRGLTKLDFAGHPIRAERPFRILAETPDGERTFEADIVLDASGGFVVPAAIGSGGVPAPGEKTLGNRLIRDLGRLDRERESLQGQRILLVGHGHSAANALPILSRVASQAPTTRVTWAVRSSNRRPCAEIANDPLPERQAVAAEANDLAENPPKFLTVRRRVMVESFSSSRDGIEVTFTNGSPETFDRVVALTGYRPDSSFLSELNVEFSPVTDGGARLFRAVSNVTDCLSVPDVSLRDLESGEPGFYLVGSKSYGRARTFLLKNGLAQLETILASL